MTESSVSDIVTPRAPSALRKRMARGLRWLLWSTVGVWLTVFALWSVLHGLILPRIDEYRPQLQEQAYKALGLPVQFAALRVGGTWLQPWLEVEDFTIRSLQGEEALRLPRVVVAFSPWSLLRGSLQQVLIENPSLDIERDGDGEFWMAGLPMGRETQEGVFADWLFSQLEVVVRGGTVQWRDALRHGETGPTLRLTEVDAVVRNVLHRHEWRIDATPEQTVGQRLSLRGQFQQSPGNRPADWRTWSGEAYVDWARVDLAALGAWVPLSENLGLQKGQGALRAWLDVVQGEARNLMLDMSMVDVHAQLGQRLPTLALKHLQGRVGLRRADGVLEVQGQRLVFETQEGERWPGGNWRLRVVGENFQQGSLTAEALDLEALAQVLRRLPLPAPWHTVLAGGEPKGELLGLTLEWQDGAPWRYAAKGRVRGLHWRQLAQAPAPWSRLPGVQGVSADFDMNQEGGKAKVNWQQGSLTLHAGLKHLEIALDQASAQLQWQTGAANAQLTLSQGRIANADLAGDFSGQWRPGEGLGWLDLTANLERARAERVVRYLPEALSPEALSYVEQSVTQGQLRKGKVRIKGPLDERLFSPAKDQEFAISAQITAGRYLYVPGQPRANAWPALEGIEGELSFRQRGLSFKGTARLEGAPNLRWTRIEASVPDLRQPEVTVQGDGKGPLAELLQTLGRGALNEVLGRQLERAQGSGAAEYRLDLRIPVDKPQRTDVKARVLFADNELQAVPGTPWMSRLRGQLHITQNGFQAQGMKVRMLGGDAEIQGGLRFDAAGAESADNNLRIKGGFTAEGLRQARELGFVTRVAQRALGRADYQANLALRRGEPELVIQSDLRGLGLNLPAPANKAGAATLPLRIETQVARETPANRGRAPQDQLRVSLGRQLQIVYQRDLGTPQAQVLAGAIALGSVASPTLPNSGVTLQVQNPSLDLDAWSAVLDEWAGAPVSNPIQARGAAARAQAAAGDATAYLPTQLNLQVDELRWADRLLQRVSVNGARQGDWWRLLVKAEQVNGSVDLRPASGNTPAQVQARLSHLVLPPSVVTDMDQILASPKESLPSLDIVVQDLTLRDKKLGRLEIEAVNRPGRTPQAREWMLNKLNLTVPEASFVGKGQWLLEPGGRRRTQLDFNLDIKDAGELLARLGTPDTVRRGSGRIEGQLNWLGSPASLDYPSLGGRLHVSVEKGQFLKTEPGAGRLLGILNLQALPRRLSLDFSDVFREGFAFDFFRGDARIEQGVVYTNNLQMKGVTAAALIEGQADIARETQSLKVVVVPDLNAGNASLYMATINPVIGLTSFLAQLVLSKPLAKAGTSEFRIEGSWANPQVTKVD